MSLKEFLFDDKNTGKKRLLYPDVLRIIGCAAIVMVHVTQTLVMRPEIETGIWLTGCTYYAMSNWAIQIFFMISGALLLSEPDGEINTFLKKRTLRILPPFIAWSAIYICYRYKYAIIDGQLPPVQSIIDVVSSPANSHLWFLYTIIIFYLWAPLIKFYAQKAPRKLLEYILIVGIVSTNIYLIVQHYTGINIGIFVWIFDIPGFFLLGYYLHTYEIGHRLRNIVYILSLVSVPLIILLTYLERADFDGYFIYRWSPFLFIIVIGIFIFIKRIRWEKYSRRFKWFSKAVATGGILSFGVYLIHPIIHDFFSHQGWDVRVDGFLFHPVISIPLITIGITLASFALSWVISKIPLIKRIIGA